MTSERMLVACKPQQWEGFMSLLLRAIVTPTCGMDVGKCTYSGVLSQCSTHLLIFSLK